MRNERLNIFLGVLIVVLLPLAAWGGDEIRYKQARSVYADDKGVGMVYPEGIACAGDRLVVADTGNGRLLLFTLQAGEPRGGTEIVLPEVLYPIRLAMTPAGDLYVLDQRQRKIARLSPSGEFKNYVEITGLPLDGTVIPAGVSTDSAGNLYVLDMAGGRVLIFGDDGALQRHIAFPKEYGFISDIAVGPNGMVFLLDSVGAFVYSNAKDKAAFAPATGKLTAEVQFPANMTVNEAGVLFISDQNGGSVLAVRPDGTVKRLFGMGWNEGQLRYPAQLCFDRDADLFIADRNNNRVQEYALVK